MPATVLVSIEQHFLMIPFQEYALPLVLSIQQKINHLFRTGSSVALVTKKDVNSSSVGMQSFPYCIDGLVTSAYSANRNICFTHSLSSIPAHSPSFLLASVFVIQCTQYGIQHTIYKVSAFSR